MADLLATLRKTYDVVLIDAPPLLPVTDAALLARQADGAILVVKHGTITRDQVRLSVQRLEQVDARLVGVVMNMLPAKGRGYGYGYGYGYAPDDSRHV
jgi:receptor protein-tyrosine kinase